MALVLGIDEAGRGPVVGSLVIAGVLIEKKDEDKLRNIGVRDSKLLSPRQREDLFEKIKKIAKKHKILIIKQEEIDEVVLKSTKKYNLNWFEADKSIEIINSFNADTVILDCPSVNIEKYSEYVKNKMRDKIKNKNKKIELIVEHKADTNHPVVAAASILAKVTRDEEIQKIKQKYGIEFGSGYPSDPITQAFLEKNWNKYPIFRKSWDSWKKAKEKKAQRGIMDF